VTYKEGAPIAAKRFSKVHIMNEVLTGVALEKICDRWGNEYPHLI